MNSQQVHKSLDNVIIKVEKGEMSSESAKAIEGAAREKRSLWKLVLEYASHRNTMAHIKDLED